MLAHEAAHKRDWMHRPHPFMSRTSKRFLNYAREIRCDAVAAKTMKELIPGFDDERLKHILELKETFERDGNVDGYSHPSRQYRNLTILKNPWGPEAIDDLAKHFNDMSVPCKVKRRKPVNPKFVSALKCHYGKWDKNEYRTGAVFEKNKRTDTSEADQVRLWILDCPDNVPEKQEDSLQSERTRIRAGERSLK